MLFLPVQVILFLPVQVILFLPSHRILFLIFAFIVSTPFVEFRFHNFPASAPLR
jgi:hypothetical protein